MGSYPPASSSSLRINRLPAALTGTFWHGGSRKALPESPGIGEDASKSLSKVLRISPFSTSRHMDLPEELLQDIFVQLNFARRCSLQRICRRWKAIMQTNFVRRMIVCTRTRTAFPIDSFKEALSHVQNVVLIGDDSFKAALSQVQNVALIGDSSRDDDLCQNDVDMILELVMYKAPHGRLVVQNIHTGPLRFDDFDAGFGTVELRNVTFAGVTIFRFASTVAEDDDRLDRVRDVLDEDSVEFTVVGPYILYDGPLDATGKGSAFRKLAADNLPPLPATDMVILRSTMEVFEETVVRKMISDLLSLFQPEVQLLPGQDLTKLDYGNFSSLVCRLLFAWNGTPPFDDDEGEDDGDGLYDTDDDEDDSCSVEEYLDDDDDDEDEED